MSIMNSKGKLEFSEESNILQSFGPTRVVITGESPIMI